MNLTYCYRSTRDDVRQAHKNDTLAAARVEGQGEAFAKQFGARPLFTIGYDSHFAGITFDKEHPCRHPDVWTKSSPAMPLVVPRDVKDVPMRARPAWESIRDRYNSQWPVEAATPRDSELLRRLYVPRENLMGQEMVFFSLEGDSYIATTFPIPVKLEGLTEIVASEFLVAQNRSKTYVVGMQAGIQPVSEEEALAAIAAQKEAANG